MRFPRRIHKHVRYRSRSPSTPDLDVLEDPERVGDEDGGGVVGADEVVDDPFFVNAHEPDVQAGLGFVGDAGLVQADDALVFLTDSHDEDGGGAAFGDGDLVAREDGHVAPRVNHAAHHLDALRVEAAAVAFTAKGGDGARVCEVEPRLPPPGEHFVHVVWGGRPAAGGDALFEVGVVQ